MTPVNTEQPRPLSPKIQRFVEAYLELWNATEAARVAQYGTPEKQGSRLMKRPDVQAAIQARLNEAAMPANEVLARITQAGRVNIAMFLTNVDYVDSRTGQPRHRVELNWDTVKEYGYLIKGLNWSKAGDPVLTLVDSQRAQELLGKHHKLFIDQVEHSGEILIKGYVGVTPDDWDEPSE